VNKQITMISTAIFFLALCAAFLWWGFYARFYKSTDDSYVSGNKVWVTPKVNGFVTSILADDTNFVEAGDLLIELNAEDRKIELEKAKSNLAQKVRDVTKLFETVYVLLSEYERAECRVIDLESKYLSRKAVIESGAISEEEFTTSETLYYEAVAHLNSAKYQLMRGFSEVQNTNILTHPLIEKAKSELKEAYLNLERCKIISPVTGVIAERKIAVGQTVDKGTLLLCVVPLTDMWVDANFKEIDLESIRIGQVVDMKSDVYGRRVNFKGEVQGIGMGSGSVFAPIPPQNASGNWIKIVQRVPVRISLDSRELKRNPLRLGLSMKVDIDVRNQDGPMVQEKNTPKFSYKTEVYEDELKGIDKLIDEVIQQNITIDIASLEKISSMDMATLFFKRNKKG
jgi:membrane fusion protein (multidrug efflux system)